MSVIRPFADNPGLAWSHASLSRAPIREAERKRMRELQAAEERRDGPRYVEARAGQAGWRQSRFYGRMRRISPHGGATGDEIAHGCPVGFRSFLDNRETPRMACADSPSGQHESHPERWGDNICVWCLE